MNRALTLLICSHNRATLLESMLSSLDEANRPEGWDVDVLVVANACTDTTHELLKEREVKNPQHLPLRWVSEPIPGKSLALNRGIGMLTSGWVALTDDDHRVDHDFLRAITDAIEAHPDTGLYCGRILPDWDGTEPSWVHASGPYRIYPPPIPVFDEGDTEKTLTADDVIPGGGNLVVRVEILRSFDFSAGMGPQGHNFGGGEDTELVLGALRRGETLRYVPGIIQFHHVDQERLRLGNLMRLAYQRTRAITRVKGHPGRGIPPYLLKKLGIYLVSAVISLSTSRSRFFLVRTASALGELRGILEGRNR